MSTKMKNCPVCGESIAANAKSCPHCGAKNKKPFYKKWWLWAIVSLVLIFIVFGGTENNTSPETPQTNSTQESREDTGKEPVHTENIVADTYLSIAQNAGTEFTINEKAQTFMKNHSDYFPGNSEIQGAISDLVDDEITYAHLSKSINKYGDKLIQVFGNVVEITESDDGSVTYLHLQDYDGNNFIIYHLGVLDNLFDGSYTWGYALPLDKISFENMGGSYTEAIVCAGCYIDNSEQVD